MKKNKTLKTGKKLSRNNMGTVKGGLKRRWEINGSFPITPPPTTQPVEPTEPSKPIIRPNTHNGSYFFGMD